MAHLAETLFHLLCTQALLLAVVNHLKRRKKIVEFRAGSGAAMRIVVRCARGSQVILADLISSNDAC
jgi:hypothetical protein